MVGVAVARFLGMDGNIGTIESKLARAFPQFRVAGKWPFSGVTQGFFSKNAFSQQLQGIAGQARAPGGWLRRKKPWLTRPAAGRAGGARRRAWELEKGRASRAPWGSSSSRKMRKEARWKRAPPCARRVSTSNFQGSSEETSATAHGRFPSAPQRSAPRSISQ